MLLFKKSGSYSKLPLCLFCVIFLAAAHAINISVLLYAAIGFYLFVMISAPVDMILPMMLFFIPWSTIIKTSPGTVTFYTIASILCFCIFLFKNLKTKIDKFYIIIPLLLVITTVTAKIMHNYSFSKSYIMFFFMLVSFPIYIHINGKNIDFETCVIFYSIGIISAAAAAYWLMDYNHMRAYIDVYKWESVGLTRLSGFYGDANFYSAQIITAIGGLLVIIVTNNKRIIGNFLLLIALIISGLISVSKSFVICLFIVFVFFLLIIFFKRTKIEKKINLLFGILLCVFLILWSGIFDKQISQYLIRFGMVDSASSLTTGRADIWMDYLRYFSENTFDFILGQGYSYEMIVKSSHNTIIQVVYQFGIIGTILLIIWLKNIFSNCEKAPKNTLLILVMFLFSCFFMWLGLDVINFDDFFITISFCIIGIKYFTPKNDRITNTAKTDLRITVKF